MRRCTRRRHIRLRLEGWKQCGRCGSPLDHMIIAPVMSLPMQILLGFFIVATSIGAWAGFICWVLS